MPAHLALVDFVCYFCYSLDMIQPDKLTEKSALALQSALQNAVTNSHSQLEPAHLLQSLIEQTDTAVHPLLEASGINILDFSLQLENLLKNKPTVSNLTLDQIRPSAEFIKVSNAASEEMQR